MINYIFGIFIIIGIIYSIITNNIETLNNTILTSGTKAIDITLKMIPMICLWLGLMKIAEKSGLLDKMSRCMSKIIIPIFPELKKDSKSISYISSNIVMNALGLGNAATPFGLKAMKSMQEENINKNIASRSMITFLIINTASVTLIPTNVISLRMLYNSKNPQEIISSSIIVTILSLFIGLIIDRIFYNIWRKYD